MSHITKRIEELERLLVVQRDLAAHRVMFGSPEASPAFLARLERSENEVRRLQADNDELRRELTRQPRRRLRVVGEASA